MTTFEGSKMSLIASGGLDTNLVLVPIQGFFEEYQRSISGLPQQPSLSSAISQNLFICWWEREVGIWRVKRSGAEEKCHKLVARIALKGEENISSASISVDGTLVAISTAGAIKVFGLTPDRGSGRDVVRVRKLETMATRGARLVQFSPNGQWLAIISHSNDIRLARIDMDQTAQQLSSRVVTLTRVRRERGQRNIALRNYVKTITRTQFSPDSSVFVVSDIAGYIDWWNLVDADASSKTNGKQSKDDAEESDSDSEDEASSVVAGQLWKRNPATEVLPRVDSTPLVLSFRPLAARSLFNRISGQADHRLLVITAAHKLHEFSLSDGSITEWSKRNPTAVLPERFRELKDRVMGAFWTEGGWCWFYGSNWMFGLDASVNHPINSTNQATSTIPSPGESAMANDRKRKWGESGAGGRIKKRDLSGLVRDDGERNELMKLNGVRNDADSDLDLEDDDGVILVDGLKAERNGASNDDEKPKWWMTLKYRPILGILPIAVQGGGGHAEVVLVERPIWDLKLPPRFESAHQR